MIILGIETSCDETAVALVNEEREILSHMVQSQIATHQIHGGVVPEIAARAHLQHLAPLIQQVLATAKLSGQAIDAVAAVGGPGLIGGILVGVMMAKALAAAWQKPFIAVNHLEGHALTVRLTENIDFPYLLLLVSGGHTQFLIVTGVGNYQFLGGTLDDAIGEAFDKVGKLLNLPYPGGPEIEQLALRGDATRFTLPKPLFRHKGCNFSFAGLKTAVRLQVEKMQDLSAQDREDIAAAFQKTIADCLLDRTINAFQATPHLNQLVVAGGVAANQYLKQRLSTLCAHMGKRLVTPPISLCTDNGAMIAWAGLERFRLGWQDDLAFTPRPRWPLSELSAP